MPSRRPSEPSLSTSSIGAGGGPESHDRPRACRGVSSLIEVSYRVSSASRGKRKPTCYRLLGRFEILRDPTQSQGPREGFRFMPKSDGQLLELTREISFEELVTLSVETLLSGVDKLFGHPDV